MDTEGRSPAMKQNAATVPLTRDNDILIECPRCGFQKIVNIAKFFKRSNIGNFDAACKCGYSFNVVLERRQFERRYFDTKGSLLYERPAGKPESFAITVNDVSRSGVRFKTEKMPPFKAGAGIVVTFEFNDNRKTYFIKEATIRDVTENDVRAEFKTLCGDIAVLTHSPP